LKIHEPELRNLVDTLALSPQEISGIWEQTRNEAANKGTWMHYEFERWLNREHVQVHDHSQEMKLFIKYIETLEDLTAYRTEWKIFGEDEDLAGSVDFLAEAADGSLVMIDWKRAKQLEDSFFTCYRRTLSAPLDHIQDCKG